MFYFFVILIIFYVEKAYRLIHNDNKTKNLGDINKINEKQLNFNKRIDLLTYTFPCQDLSLAGSFWGFNKGMAEKTKTRSSLLWQVGRILKILQKNNNLPKKLMLENVVNMISKKHINEYNKWILNLKNLGYSTKTIILNGYDYGIPQKRKRVFGISFLNYCGKVDKKGNILDIDNKDFKFITKQKTLKELLKTNYNDTILKCEALKAQPNRTPSREKMFRLNPNLLNVDYIRTLTTRQDRHPNCGTINLKNTIIGGKNRPFINNMPSKANYRFLTSREAFLFMGFENKDYNKIKNNFSYSKKLLFAGNSIIVPVLESIFHFMFKLKNE